MIARVNMLIFKLFISDWGHKQLIPDFFRKPAKPASSAPSLKTRLRLSIIIIVLPLFILGGIGFLFFQKSTNAFNLAIEEVVSDVIPVTELKDKIQKTVTPFNRYLETGALDEKNRFLQLSKDIQKALNHPAKQDATQLSLANDIYQSLILTGVMPTVLPLKFLTGLIIKMSRLRNHLSGCYRNSINMS